MEIVIKNNQRLIKANYRAIEKVLRGALTHLACKGYQPLISGKRLLKHLEVSVLLVNDAGMKRLNLFYRGMDRTTDVLSFPLMSNEDLKAVSKKPSFNSQLPLSASHLVLGDIVISLPQARRQAAEYKTTFYRELARLLVHGLLHLLGYDHEKSSYRAAIMRRLEAELEEVLCL